MIGFILWLWERRKSRKNFMVLTAIIEGMNVQVKEIKSKMMSNAVRYGQKFEQLVPFATAFPYNPKDVRFLGSPIDLVVFNGLDTGEVKEIVFVEVKTGQSNLSHREKLVQNCIQDGRIRWEQMRDVEG